MHTTAPLGDFLGRVIAAMSVLLCLPSLDAAATWTYASSDRIALETSVQAMEEAMATGDVPAAIGHALAAQEEAEVVHIETLYNLAALYARSTDEESAYVWLTKALEAGFWDFGHLRLDEDFASMRSQERFTALVRASWSKQYIAMLEREERDGFQKPDEVMHALAFRAGERVADVGAGSGYFTLRIAEAVGPAGSVLATDIRQEMIDHLRQRLHEAQVQNVDLALVPADDPGLESGGFDTILLVDVWHYIRDPRYAQKLRDGLAPGGRVVIIDYRPRPFEERPWGPPPVQQTPREEVDEHFAAAGLVPVEVYDFLPEQYFVVYRVR
jgi:arsenite methyltransferase